MFRLFLYSCLLSVAWRHYDSGQIFVFIEIVLPLICLGAACALVIRGLRCGRAAFSLNTLRPRGNRARTAVWLSIFNQWLLLALITVAYLLTIPEAQLTEGEHTEILRRHLAAVLPLAALVVFNPRLTDRILNLLVLVITLTLGYELYRVHHPPTPANAVVLQSPFEQPFSVISGGNSRLNNVMMSRAREPRKYTVYLSPGDSRFRQFPLAAEPFPPPFGAPVHAPADGVVVAAVNHLPDHPMGERAFDVGPGNYVLIKTPEDRYLIMAGLLQNSLRVDPGDRVVTGEPLARVGKSGSASEPVLLLAVFEHPDLFAPDNRSLPLYFKGLSQRENGPAKNLSFPSRNIRYFP